VIINNNNEKANCREYLVEKMTISESDLSVDIKTRKSGSSFRMVNVLKKEG